LKVVKTFCQDQDQGQDFYFQDQDQDQDFIFCPRGASRPRLWSRGLHHCFAVLMKRQVFVSFPRLFNKATAPNGFLRQLHQNT